MVFSVESLHSVLGNVGINLCCGQITVAQQKLHNPQVRPIIEQMGRKGMPHGVRRQRKTRARLSRMSFDQIPKGSSGHRPTAITWKQHLVRA